MSAGRFRGSARGALAVAAQGRAPGSALTSTCLGAALSAVGAGSAASRWKQSSLSSRRGARYGRRAGVWQARCSLPD